MPDDHIIASAYIDFGKEPNWAKYLKSQSGPKMQTQWNINMYGGNVLDPVYSCPELTKDCTKENNLVNDMNSTVVQKFRYGYFTFQNIKDSTDDGVYYDIDFFTRNISSTALADSFVKSNNTASSNIKWDDMASSVTGWARIIMFKSSDPSKIIQNKLVDYKEGHFIDGKLSGYGRHFYNYNADIGFFYGQG